MENNLNYVRKSSLFLSWIKFWLIILNLLKFLELGIVAYIKNDFEFLFCALGILGCSIYLYTKKIIFLIVIFSSNIILIFIFDKLNQHFAYITSLLFILILHDFLKVIKYNTVETNRIVISLLIFQTSILYFFAAVWKINKDYFTGMQLIEHSYTFLIVPNPAEPNPIFYITLSLLAILIEFVLAVQFLFDNKALEIIQSIGFLFHASFIFIIGEGIRNSFQLIIFMSAVFLTYPLFDMRNFQESRWIVFWDSNCDFCSKSIKFLKFFDHSNYFTFYSNELIGSYREVPFDRDLSNHTIIVWNRETNNYIIKSQAMIFILANNPYFWVFKPITTNGIFFKPFNKLYDKIALSRSCGI
jgi:predicted DCC family thiol-disulfide oxidoreductase YuxK